MLNLIREDAAALAAPLNYDYSLIAEEHREKVRSAARDIKSLGVRVKESMISMGQRLLETKELLPHGQFQVWIETEFGLAYRTAAEWMNAARQYHGKSAAVALLSDSAMMILAAPSVPEAAREQAIAEAQANGKSPTKQRVKEIVDQHKPETPTQELARFSRLAADNRAQMKPPAAEVSPPVVTERYADALSKRRQRNLVIRAIIEDIDSFQQRMTGTYEQHTNDADTLGKIALLFDTMRSNLRRNLA